MIVNDEEGQEAEKTKETEKEIENIVINTGKIFLQTDFLLHSPKSLEKIYKLDKIEFVVELWKMSSYSH